MQTRANINHTTVSILGTGAYLPAQRVTNDDLAKIVETSDEWIRTRSGIEERRIAKADESTSDLAVAAAKVALKKANLPTEAIDLIVVATASPDKPFPATACYVQAKLGLSQIPAFDVSAVCSGFPYGLEVATAMLVQGHYKHVLLIGAEKFSPLLDWQDRTTCVLFGDGAGAVILGKNQPQGLHIIDSILGAQGSEAHLLMVPAGGSTYPTSPQSIENRDHFVKMQGREVFKHAVRVMADTIDALLKRNGLTAESVTQVIPHQANVRILEAVAKSLNIPFDRFFINLNRYGNTSAASIPIALDEACEKYTWKPGDTLLLVAFGAGLTWGCTLLQYR